MPKVLSDLEVEDFRERLCDAAAKLFEKKGPNSVSLREIATEIGVSPMTPYRYFRDKDEILAAVRARAFNKFAKALEDGYASGNDAGSRANAAGEAYIRFAFADPSSYRMMFDLSQPNDNDYPELADAAARARLTLTRHIHPLVEQGYLEGDPEIIGHVYWAVLHGAVTLALAGKLSEKPGFQTIIGSALTAVTLGFRPMHNNAD